MAIVACKECGGQVSDKAAACPHCGAPVAKSAAKPPSKGNGCAAIILLLIVALLFAMCSSKSGDTGPDKSASAECDKADLRCLGDRAVSAASVYCKDPIERLARHSVKWTDGTFEMKFSHYRWANQEAGVITMIGDKAEFQNGFGAYTPVTYECDLAADRKTVLDVRVREGRLP